LEPVSAVRSKRTKDTSGIKVNVLEDSKDDIKPLDDGNSEMITITSNDHVQLQVNRKMARESEFLDALMDQDKDANQFTLSELNGKQIQWVWLW
jgi:hypothetical protein